MSFEAERARIETHFRDQWALTAFSAVPVLYENTNIKQPSADFLLHRLASAEGMQIEIVGPGPAFHRYAGLVQVDIVCTVGSGTAQARKLADAVANIYRRQQLTDGSGGIITFRTPSFRAMGTYSERYRFVVSCPYQRDIRH